MECYESDATVESALHGSPTGIAGLTVLQVHDVDVFHHAPFDAAAIHVRDAVGREVGDHDAQRVVAFLQQSAHVERKRHRPRAACKVAVDTSPRSSNQGRRASSALRRNVVE